MRIRMLVVDDSPAFLDAAVKVLRERQEVEIVGTASSGREALGIAPGLAPDLVLTDLMMPGMNGFELAPQVLALCPGAKVVIASISDEEEYRTAALKCGAYEFIAKANFVDAVDALLERLVRDGRNAR